jgi:hypothetical protein
MARGLKLVVPEISENTGWLTDASRIHTPPDGCGGPAMVRSDRPDVVACGFCRTETRSPESFFDFNIQQC